MIHYLLLSIYTIIICFLVLKTWLKTKHIGFLLGSFFLYYWSLLGSWFIVYDTQTNQGGKELGIAYYHYLELLFPVKADNTYLLATFFMAVFVIGILLTVWLFTKKKEHKIETPKNYPISINHYLLLIGSVVGIIISLLIIKKEILIAAKFEHSVYYITRNYHGKFFTIHQILNQIVVASLFVGLVSQLSGKKALFFKANDNVRLTAFWYFLTVIFVESFLLFIGNKREIFFGCIFGLLFYLHNVNFKFQPKIVFVFLVITVTPLVLNDGLRSLSPTFLVNYFDVSDLEFIPLEKITYTSFSAKNTVLRFLFSNEMFVPHFSMYGVLSHDLPKTYGSSLVSLFGSMVPKALWPNRPDGIYTYYFNGVNATPGTGYTIHHATAWYLNFGFIGILLGSFIVGRVWSFLYNVSNLFHEHKNKFVQILYALGFSAFCAHIPAILRSGPEGYKALLFEAMLIPTFVLTLTVVITTYIKRTK